MIYQFSVFRRSAWWASSSPARMFPGGPQRILGQYIYRQVLLLAAAQALFQTVSVLVMTVGGLAGAQITPRPDLATLPIAAMFLGTATMTFRHPCG